MPREALPSFKVQGRGYIDYLELHEDPSQHHLQLVVTRVYAQVTEQLDLTQQVAWVRFRQAQQGGDE